MQRWKAGTNDMEQKMILIDLRGEQFGRMPTEGGSMVEISSAPERLLERQGQGNTDEGHLVVN